MALHLIESATRLSLVAGLSVILVSCASSPTPVASDRPSATVVNRDVAAVRTPPVSSDGPRTAYLAPDAINPDAPSDYTVVRGDTLWDISGRFLNEPWLWPQIWNVNPQIDDPHWIYPGDALALRYVNGSPSLTLTQANRGGVAGRMLNASNGGNNGGGNNSGGITANTLGADGRTKVSPRIRSTPIDSAIPTIKSDAISQFLINPRVVDITTVANAPYTIADGGGRLMSSLGSKIFVRGTVNRDQLEYNIYRKNKPLIDPVSGATLGYELIHVSDAKLLNVGDVSTLGLTSNIIETKKGDILLPAKTEAAIPDFMPRMPEMQGEARVVSLVDAISQSGRDQVIVLNVGAQSDIAAGDVLAIETRGGSIEDNVGGRRDTVQLPNQRTGVVMVFQTFDKVSYALVMESTRPIKVNDIVTGI